MSSHLNGGRLNVAIIQEVLRKELLNLFQQCEGPKVTVWDEWLAGPVGLIANHSLLKEHEIIEMYPLKPGTIPEAKVQHIIFISRPKLNLMDIVADYILSIRSHQNMSVVKFHLFFVPNKSDLCRKHLIDRGVLGSIEIQEFQSHIFPFDSDLLSMEVEKDFREIYLEKDPTCLYNLAQALKRIQELFGVFPRIVGRGPSAKTVWELFCKLSKEDRNQEQRLPAVSTVDQVLLLDRTLDLTSVLVTQLSYEGLIDELFGVKSTTATLPGNKFVTPDERNTDMISYEKKRIILNSSDELFVEIRDKNFISVGSALSKKARVIKTQMEESRQDKTVQEIKHFVSRLPQILATKQSLATHTAIAESIKEIVDTFEFQDMIETEEDFLLCVDTDKIHPFIEEMIAHSYPLVKVLRLIALQCATSSGLKTKLLEFYKREIMQVYGIKSWLAVCNMEKVGLLKPQTGVRNYAVVRKSLQLTSDENNECTNNYLKSKYTPITVRLAENLARNKNWTRFQETISTLPGPIVDEIQTTHSRLNRRNSFTSTSSSSETSKVILVVFIGGCTYGEVSALRKISKTEDSNVEFVVLTTKMINGNTFIEALLED